MDKKKLLVVVDMQNDFIDGALGSKDAQAIVPNVVKKIKHWDGDIILTRDTHGKNYLETREGRHLPVVHCIKWTDGWNINDKVMAAVPAGHLLATVDKDTFGSFDLAALCLDENKRCRYDYIEAVGLCTDICLVSCTLILKNAFPEVDVAVDSNCCAGVTPESHEAALLTMKMCQVEIV